MIEKKEIVTGIYCTVLILITFITPVIYDSETISESAKSLYGIFAKGISVIVFLIFAYTLIKNRNK